MGERARVTQHDLKEGDLVQIGASHILRFVFQDQLDEAALRTLVDNAIRDSLTGVFNRSYFLDQLRKDVSSAIRHQQHLSLAMMGLDLFKQINDEKGHAMGDLVLRHCSRAVGTLIRSEDTFGRIGGEEFASRRVGRLAQESTKRFAAAEPVGFRRSPPAMEGRCGQRVLLERRRRADPR